MDKKKTSLKKSFPTWLLCIIIALVIIGAMISVSFYRIISSCNFSLTFYNIPVEILNTKDSYYEYYPELDKDEYVVFEDERKRKIPFRVRKGDYDYIRRQFVEYTPFCNQRDELLKNELIIFKDGDNKEIPARIIGKDNGNFTVLTIDGEKVIQSKQIIADD